MRCRHPVTCVAVGNASLDGLKAVRGWQRAQRALLCAKSAGAPGTGSWPSHRCVRLHRCEVYTCIMTSDSSSPTPARPETRAPSEAGEAGPCRERFENLPLAVTGDPEADIWGEGSTKLLLGDMAGDWKVVYTHTHTHKSTWHMRVVILFCLAARVVGTNRLVMSDYAHK